MRNALSLRLHVIPDTGDGEDVTGGRRAHGIEQSFQAVRGQGAMRLIRVELHGGGALSAVRGETMASRAGSA